MPYYDYYYDKIKALKTALIESAVSGLGGCGSEVMAILAILALMAISPNHFFPVRYGLARLTN
jgi:hypothetical protein